MYSKFPLKLVVLDLFHEDCWTSHIENDTIKVVSHKIYGNLVRDVVICNYESFKTLKKLNDKHRIKNIINVSAYEGKKVLVDMYLSYDDSVLSILNKNNVIILEPTIVYGNEKWFFLAYDFQINKVINDLKNYAKINKISVKDYKPEDNNLNETEVDILKIALDLGYFDRPRKITIKELANKLKMSEMTVVYYLRNAEKKIIENFLKENAS